MSVFSTFMHSSILGARPGGFLCRHTLSSQCALHKTITCMNNLGIRQEIWQNLFRKIDFVFETIRKNRFSDPRNLISVSKVFGKIDFHYAGRLHTLYCGEPWKAWTTTLPSSQNIWRWSEALLAQIPRSICLHVSLRF